MNKRLLIKIGLILLVGGFFSVFSFAAQQDNAWTAFNEGSWALYELTGGMQQKQTLTKKSESEIVLRTEVIMNGSALSSVDVKIPLDLPSGQQQTQQQDSKVKEYSDNVQINGKDISCKVYEIEAPQGVSKSWISQEVPGGIVRSTLNDNVVMQLIDYEVK